MTNHDNDGDCEEKNDDIAKHIIHPCHTHFTT